MELSEQQRTVRMGNQQKTVKMEIDEDQEMINNSFLKKRDRTNTVRMPSEAATVKMGETLDTVVMGQSEPTSENNGYVQIGDYLDGKYHITRNLTYNTGEATLFICEYKGQTLVAKVYHQNMKPKDEVSERIYSIQSKYVIPVLDHGTDVSSGRYYEMLPFYEKGDLSKHLSFDHDFLMEVIAYSLNEGLHAIHEAGIIHRDIKPNNLFLNEDSTSIIIGDFGISSTLDQGSVALTENANRTNGYAAPEVYSRYISEESDYYSFGITLLELAIGENPFKHLTEQQILKMTLMDQIDIPANIPDRLTTLIKGLTRKDRNIRWGYSEVKKWLNGEHVAVAEDTFKRNIRPYRFEGKDINSLEELAMMFAENWDVAKKHLYSGLVKDFVGQFGEEFEVKVMECEEIRDQDMGIHMLINGLHPNPPLCWKGTVYRDLTELEKIMKDFLPNVHSVTNELLDRNLLLPFLKRNKVDQEHADFYREVQKIQEKAKEDTRYAYYQLAFLLGGHREFLYQGRSFSTIEDLITFLHQNQDRIDGIASELIHNRYFFAWLAHNGYEKHAEQWRALR